MSTWSEDALLAEAARAALRHKLPPALVCAVVDQESSWDRWALRYEQGFFDRYIQPLLEARSLRNVTEARARAFSWGLMQVMGQTAREQGFTGPLPRLCQPEIGLEWGCRYFAVCLQREKKSGGVRTIEKALLRYNGGADRHYPDLVLARVDRYVSQTRHWPG